VIVLDLSRLISRAGRATPTGIDRVELAYARHLIAHDAAASFAATTPWGGLGPLPRPAAEKFVAAVAQAWRGERTAPAAAWLRATAVRHGGRSLHARLRQAAGGSIYLLVSHHHLERRRLLARLKQRGRAGFVALVHDLVPIDLPEYARPGQDGIHRRRIETVAALADAVIVNSAATRAALQPWLDRAGRTPLVLVAPFGVDLPPLQAETAAATEPPYFIAIGTIEGRKNHLLLLNLWRRLAEESGAAAPRLVLVGARGWEAENAIDMLDRCPALRGLVIERNGLSDAETARLLRGARALLLPSFAEGFGFPLVEALAQGVPVLCSNIAALREAGGEAPDFLDPLDGLGWRAAIRDYSDAVSARREAQLRRLALWRPPRWQDHFAAVEELIAGLARVSAAIGRGRPLQAVVARSEAQNVRATLSGQPPG
jgi:glycosyltransferase involved in cell wall biosynthesis